MEMCSTPPKNCKLKKLVVPFLSLGCLRWTRPGRNHSLAQRTGERRNSSRFSKQSDSLSHNFGGRRSNASLNDPCGPNLTSSRNGNSTSSRTANRCPTAHRSARNPSCSLSMRTGTMPAHCTVKRGKSQRLTAKSTASRHDDIPLG